jgi:hypothetical protein
MLKSKKMVKSRIFIGDVHGGLTASIFAAA